MRLWVYAADENAALGIIERYSFLRAVRMYDAPGGIEFVTPLAVLDDMSRLSPGQFIWPQGYAEAYIIESVTMSQRLGGTELTVRGRTLTCLLGRRCLPDVARYTGAAGTIVRRLIEDVFADQSRTFPGWSMTNADGLGETASYITSGETLLEAVGSVCRGSGLGFRTVFDPAVCSMRFELYEGEDRFDENALEPVALDPEFDSLVGLSAAESVQGFANVLYVIGEVNSATGITRKLVVDSGQEATGERVSGLDRYERAMRYSATSVTDGSGSVIGRPPSSAGSATQLSNAQYQDSLRAYALNYLRTSARGVTVDGTIAHAERTLGAALALGDIVRVRARSWGVDTAARVRALTEQYENGGLTSHAVVGYV
ncbi:hypothetical protein FACS1894184_00640 [Clostridia bacterium]|nr:hypothetical protein FACS1894184_00640 [Clostridia bacterium]